MYVVLLRPAALSFTASANVSCPYPFPLQGIIPLRQARFLIRSLAVRNYYSYRVKDNGERVGHTPVSNYRVLLPCMSAPTMYYIVYLPLCFVYLHVCMSMFTCLFMFVYTFMVLVRLRFSHYLCKLLMHTIVEVLSNNVDVFTYLNLCTCLFVWKLFSSLFTPLLYCCWCTCRSVLKWT